MKKIMFSSAVLIVFCLLNVMCVSENKYVGVKNQIDSLLNKYPGMWVKEDP